MIDFFDPMVIVPACLSVIVLCRLISILGHKTGHEQQQWEDLTRQGQVANDKPTIIEGTVVASQTDEDDDTLESDQIGLGLARIAAIDKTFTKKKFLDGAYVAYETILMAFSRGDCPTLKRMLSELVYSDFSESINRRLKLGHTVETLIIKIEQPRINNIELIGTIARISTRFISQLITSTKNKDGEVVTGDPCKQKELVDDWTFERSLDSQNPNWTLVSTVHP